LGILAWDEFERRVGKLWGVFGRRVFLAIEVTLGMGGGISEGRYLIRRGSVEKGEGHLFHFSFREME
jgi:hypothetical protein